MGFLKRPSYNDRAVGTSKGQNKKSRVSDVNCFIAEPSKYSEIPKTAVVNYWLFSAKVRPCDKDIYRIHISTTMILTFHEPNIETLGSKIFVSHLDFKLRSKTTGEL